MIGHHFLARFWPHFAAGFDFLAALLVSCHALLHKRDHRAATLWIGIAWLMPLMGPSLYLILGVNRIRRRAVKLAVHGTMDRSVPENMGEPEPISAEHLRLLARVVGRVTTAPLTTGNAIRPLVNGDQAFPAMLAAIESARHSISLSSYIFDNDPAGLAFVQALGRAVARGVQVRVLIDAAGSRYSWPPISPRLTRARIPHAKFLPASLLTPWRVTTINLRNHRKLMVVDGTLGFTGGMNIREGNLVASSPPQPVQDLHFQVQGPIVTDLQEAFANDWAFATDEVLDGPPWFVPPSSAGEIIARVIPDGPDGNFDNLRITLLAALAEAQSSVQIVTPYFLPDTALISALNMAALRGVDVEIFLPAKNNLPLVHWASRAMWWQVLHRGCKIRLTPPPFDHSKLMIVDSHWVLFGSGNWDARSLRLNFELNVECYGRDFARSLEQNIILEKRSKAHLVTMAEVDQRPLLSRLRDASARLFSPYL